MTKYYKAYGASTAGRIMSSQEIDQLIAQSLQGKPSMNANTSAISADKVENKPMDKPAMKSVINPFEPFAHLNAKPIGKKLGQGKEPFAHLKAGH